MADIQDRRTYLRPGFVLALALRLLTASLAILVPLYAASDLGASPAQAGYLVVLLWVGNAVGVLGATVAVRDQSVSSVAGFGLMAVSMVSLAVQAPGVPVWLEALSSGIGMGLPQPFLSALMHLDSRPGRPFSGLGLYSTALGLGLVLGPLVAYGAHGAYGFAGVFGALALVCVVGAVGGVAGAGALAGRQRPPAPSPSGWLRALRGSTFKRAFSINLLYSLMLPLFLSFGAIYAETRFGFSPGAALLLFTAVFAVSTASRFLAANLVGGHSRLLVAAAGLLLASMLCLGLAPSWQVFVLGMLCFSIPHAMIFPITSYLAFSSVGEGEVLNSSYAFQASSGVAELLTPAAAVVLIPLTGLQAVFLVAAVLAAGALALNFRAPW